MYTFKHFDMHKLQFSPSLFPPYHMFINDDKSTLSAYFQESYNKIMAAVAVRATSSHDKSGTYDSGASQQMPMSYNKSKPHD